MSRRDFLPRRARLSRHRVIFVRLLDKYGKMPNGALACDTDFWDNVSKELNEVDPKDQRTPCEWKTYLDEWKNEVLGSVQGPARDLVYLNQLWIYQKTPTIVNPVPIEPANVRMLQNNKPDPSSSTKEREGSPNPSNPGKKSFRSSFWTAKRKTIEPRLENVRILQNNKPTPSSSTKEREASPNPSNHGENKFESSASTVKHETYLDEWLEEVLGSVQDSPRKLVWNPRKASTIPIESRPKHRRIFGNNKPNPSSSTKRHRRTSPGKKRSQPSSSTVIRKTVLARKRNIGRIRLLLLRHKAKFIIDKKT